MKAAVVIKHSFDDDHESVTSRKRYYSKQLKKLISSLDKHRISHDIISVSDCKCILKGEEYDICIVLGGDGTLLQTHQYLIKTPVLAIKGDPGSRGFLQELLRQKK